MLTSAQKLGIINGVYLMGRASTQDSAVRDEDAQVSHGIVFHAAGLRSR